MTNQSADTAALAGRMEFMGLDASARAAIRSVRDVLTEALPGGLDRFYERVLAFEEARRFFRDEDHVAHARARQLEHWARLTGAEFDESYVAAVRAVGYRGSPRQVNLRRGQATTGALCHRSPVRAGEPLSPHSYPHPVPALCRARRATALRRSFPAPHFSQQGRTS